MKKLRRETEFLERGKQRVRSKLSKIQDPLLTPTTSLAVIKPKQLIRSEYQNNYRIQMIPEYAVCPE